MDPSRPSHGRSGAPGLHGRGRELHGARSRPGSGRNRNADPDPAAERPSFAGGGDTFTGDVRVSMLFGPNGIRDFGAATVTFSPSARTAWHTHPAGQTLIVTDGVGWVQLEGEPRVEMRAGDVIWIPPHVRHWHGATDTDSMTHTALQGERDGEVVRWLELVTDADYAPSND